MGVAGTRAEPARGVGGSALRAIALFQSLVGLAVATVAWTHIATNGPDAEGLIAGCSFTTIFVLGMALACGRPRWQ